MAEGVPLGRGVQDRALAVSQEVPVEIPRVQILLLQGGWRGGREDEKRTKRDSKKHICDNQEQEGCSTILGETRWGAMSRRGQCLSDVPCMRVHPRGMISNLRQLRDRNPKPTIKAAFALALVSARTYSVYCLTWSETCFRYNISRSTSTSVSQSRTRAGIY